MSQSIVKNHRDQLLSGGVDQQRDTFRHLKSMNIEIIEELLLEALFHESVFIKKEILDFLGNHFEIHYVKKINQKFDFFSPEKKKQLYESVEKSVPFINAVKEEVHTLSLANDLNYGNQTENLNFLMGFISRFPCALFIESLLKLSARYGEAILMKSLEILSRMSSPLVVLPLKAMMERLDVSKYQFVFDLFQEGNCIYKLIPLYVGTTKDAVKYKPLFDKEVKKYPNEELQQLLEIIIKTNDLRFLDGFSDLIPHMAIPSESSSEDSVNKRPLVYLVDDAQFIQVSISKSLKRNGFDVICASDSDECLDYFRARKADLIILDYGIPGINGIEVLKILMSSPKTSSIPVIMLSGFSDPQIVSSAIQIGAKDFLVKPFNEEILIGKIRHFI